MCQHKFWLNYGLCITEPSGFKAIKGNIVHKALEMAACYKLNQQNGEVGFFEEETGREFREPQFDYNWALDASFSFYSAKETHHIWKERDRKDCRDWMYMALAYHNGAFDPLKRTVVAPEQYFEFELDQPWAEYEEDGVKKRLIARGTMDLVCAVD